MLSFLARSTSSVAEHRNKCAFVTPYTSSLWNTALSSLHVDLWLSLKQIRRWVVPGRTDSPVGLLALNSLCQYQLCAVREPKWVPVESSRTYSYTIIAVIQYDLEQKMSVLPFHNVLKVLQVFILLSNGIASVDFGDIWISLLECLGE